MFTVLSRVGGDLIVGTHKGNVGVISEVVVRDIGLIPSDTASVTVVDQCTNQVRVPIVEPLFAYNITTEGIHLAPEGMQIPFEVDTVELKPYRYYDFTLWIGYSARAHQWYIREQPKD